jgi:hypothetical protein
VSHLVEARANPLGPTALGLTTTLMSLNLSPPMIRRRLLIFSFAAPLGAVLTFFIVKAFGVGGAEHSHSEIDSLGWWTGIALLFSVSLFPAFSVTQLIHRADRSYMSQLSFSLYRMTRTLKDRIPVDMRRMKKRRNWANISVQPF